MESVQKEFSWAIGNGQRGIDSIGSDGSSKVGDVRSRVTRPECEGWAYGVRRARCHGWNRKSRKRTETMQLAATADRIVRQRHNAHNNALLEAFRKMRYVGGTRRTEEG